MGARFKTGPGLGTPPNASIQSGAWELLFVSSLYDCKEQRSGAHSSGASRRPSSFVPSGLFLMALDTAGPGAPGGQPPLLQKHLPKKPLSKPPMVLLEVCRNWGQRGFQGPGKSSALSLALPLPLRPS